MKIFRRKNTWNKIEVKPFSRKCNSFTISLLSEYFSKPLIRNNFKIELVTENNIYELLFGRRLYLKKDDKTIDRSKAMYREESGINMLTIYINCLYGFLRIYLNGATLYRFDEIECKNISQLNIFHKNYGEEFRIGIERVLCNNNNIDYQVRGEESLDQSLLSRYLRNRQVLYKTIEALPIGLADSASIYIPYMNKIIVFGGYIQGANDPADKVLVYSIEGNGWSSLRNMPIAKWGHSACLDPFQEKIYLFGGHNGVDTGSREIQVYSVAEDKWEIIETDIVFERGNMCTYDPLNRVIHIINYDKEGKGYHHVFDPYKLVLRSEDPPPRPVRWGVFTFYIDKLYLVSGSNPASRKREGFLYIYDLYEKKWFIEKIPFKLHGLIREWGWLNNELYSVYGLDDQGVFYSSIYRYSLADKQWSRIGYGLIPRDGVTGYMVKNGYLYVIGGRDTMPKPRGLDIVEKINICTEKIIVYSRYSDVYGIRGQYVEVYLLDNDNNVVEDEIIIYRNEEEYICGKTIGGKIVFKPEEKGIYYAVYNGKYSNKIIII